MIFAILIAFIAFVLSSMGLFVLGLGLLTFICGPLIFRATGMFRPLARAPLWVVGVCLQRAAFVVSEHGDLLFKQMKFDDRGVETITFGDETKEFEDPDSALHHWLGVPFALADEVSGVLFDPRHAAVGQKKEALDNRGEGIVEATESEWKKHNVVEWVRGVFAMPTQHEIVDLTAVRQLVDGGERSEYPQRTEELYKNSRKPFADGSSFTKFFYPAVSFLMTFGGIWLIASQLGGSGGGDPDTTITFGSTAILFLGLTSMDVEQIREIVADKSRQFADWFWSVNWKWVLKRVTATALILSVIAALLIFAGPIMATIVLFVYVMGFAIVPVVAFLGKASSIISGLLASLMLKLGLMGYHRPVLEWTPAKYRLREYDRLQTTDNVSWYSMAGSLLGFSHKPSPDVWGDETMTDTAVENRLMEDPLKPDGGEATNIPSDCTPMNTSNRGRIGAFGPKRVSSRKYYLHSGITLGRFQNSATGEKSMRRLTQAKEKFGEDAFSVSERSVLYLTAGGGLIGVILGTLVFLL